MNELILGPFESVTVKGTAPRDNGPRWLMTWPKRGFGLTAIEVFCQPTDAEVSADEALQGIEQRPPLPPPPAPVVGKKRGQT